MTCVYNLKLNLPDVMPQLFMTPEIYKRLHAKELGAQAHKLFMCDVFIML